MSSHILRTSSGKTHLRKQHPIISWEGERIELPGGRVYMESVVQTEGKDGQYANAKLDVVPTFYDQLYPHVPQLF